MCSSSVSKATVQCYLFTELISEYFDNFSEFAQIVKQIQMLNRARHLMQKITNIVNIIANTGSAALVTQLTQLEREKELLDVQIQEEERGTKEDDLDEEAIRAAFRQAQKMFHSGTLPQMEQIINLYLDKVLVYPDYVEIHLNNVPTNILNPSQSKDEPALGGLHTFYIEKMCEKNVPQNRTRKNGQYGYNILVKLHRKEQKKAKSRKKGQKETRAQDGLDSSKTGGPRAMVLELRKFLCCRTISCYGLLCKANGLLCGRIIVPSSRKSPAIAIHFGSSCGAFLLSIHIPQISVPSEK